MTHERTRGLFGRLHSLIKGKLSIWLRDTERQHPRAVYEQAINERTRQYRELKQAVAGILYMRNKLEAEIRERRAEIARLHEETRRAVRGGDDELSLSLIGHKQALVEELERAERELEGVRSESEEAKANLLRFREEIRALSREKGRMLVTLANAQARRRIQEALEGLSVDAEMKALEGVREHIARLSTEGSLERELGDEGMRVRLRAIREEVRSEGAKRELAQLKEQIHPQALPEPEAPRGQEPVGGEQPAVSVAGG
jgi:phage shock protein A